MNTRLFSFILAAGLCGGITANSAVVGPEGNFDKNALWVHPDINSMGAEGLTTRGFLFFDMKNDVGAVDRLTEAVRAARDSHSFSSDEMAELEQVLATAEVLSDMPGAIDGLTAWLKANLASPHRADVVLLLGDLLLERGYKTVALEVYDAMSVDALSPNLRADYLYHKAYCNLKLANYSRAGRLFEDEELQQSKEYGNAARFYQGYISYINRDYSNALEIWENVNTSVLPGSMADYYKAQIAYYYGEYDKALRLAKPLLTAHTDEPLFTAEANRIVGESLYQTGQISEAIPYLKKYVSEVENPELSTRYILGLAQYEEGDYRDAVDSLTPVTADLSAMGQSAYLYIGQALLKLGDDNGAIMAFNRALTMNYDRSVTEAAYYNYAVAKSRGANVPFASSVDTFEEFLTRFPNSRYADDVAKYIVSGYVTDGNYEAALNSINKVQYPSSGILASKQKVLYQLGAKQLGADKAASAVEMLTAAKQLGEYDSETAAETNLLLGEALYRTGDYEQAADCFLEYLDEVPAYAPNRAIALYDLGYTRMAQKEWSKAQINFERLLANPGYLSRPAIADAQARLGDARYYQRNWSGAAKAYESAYHADSSTGDYPLFQKALMLGYDHDYTGKLTTLDALIEDFPTSALIPDALLEKAEAYVQTRQQDKAEEIYRNLIENYSSTSQGRRAYLYLASSQVDNGQRREAIDTYQELIELAGTSEEAQLAAEAVKRLHAEQGTLNEYADFIAGVDGAPSFDADEAETLTWNAAEHNYLSGNGSAMLSRYVTDYPQGRYKARALYYLLEEASEEGNENDSYRWATMLVQEFPDNNLTEDALAIKATIEYDRGRGGDALETWTILEQKASSPETKNMARLGIMRVARDMGDAAKLRSSADALLKSSALGAEEKTEAAFSLALADNLDGNAEGAISAWKELAKNTDELYGAKSAVYAAEGLNALKRYDEAAKLSEDFVNSGTPHTYWLARGFISLSDAYSGQGRDFEAREYLKALKDNYPGDETDIYDMIDERLN